MHIVRQVKGSTPNQAEAHSRARAYVIAFLVAVVVKIVNMVRATT